MKWRDFITPIQKSGISGDAAYKIVLDLFEYAGSKNYISEAAAKSWLSGARNCKVSSYFPAGKVDTESLFCYFRHRPENRLKQLQQSFRNEQNFNIDSPIDVGTDNMDLFCWSLINQFLDLLGFPRLEDPLSNVSQLPDSQRTDTAEGIIYDQEQHTEQQPDISGLIHDEDISRERKLSIRSAILPHSDDCCYHCDHWNGDRKTFGAYTTPTYGICLKHYRREQLSSGPACKDYKKHQKLPGEW